MVCWFVAMKINIWEERILMEETMKLVRQYTMSILLYVPCPFHIHTHPCQHQEDDWCQSHKTQEILKQCCKDVFVLAELPIV